VTWTIDDFQIGKTKVFLRAGQMADLDARRAEVLGRAARIIQRQICTYIARKQFVVLRRSATQLQSFLRGTLSVPSLFVLSACVELWFSCLIVHVGESNADAILLLNQIAIVKP
jgi:myosin heavy subunit